MVPPVLACESILLRRRLPYPFGAPAPLVWLSFVGSSRRCCLPSAVPLAWLAQSLARRCAQRMDKDQQETDGIRDTCPHCGGPLHVRTTVERAEEQPDARKTVSFAESNHPAIVAERRRRAARKMA